MFIKQKNKNPNSRFLQPTKNNIIYTLQCTETEKKIEKKKKTFRLKDYAASFSCIITTKATMKA